MREVKGSRVSSLAVGLVAFAVTLPLMGGCAVLMGTAEPDGATPSAGPAFRARLTDAAVSTVGVCLDPSRSSNASFAPEQRAMIAESVAGWATGKKATEAGAAGAPGLDLLIRQVQNDSYGDAPTLRVSIPSVAGLVPEPKSTSATFAIDDVTWQNAKRDYDSEIAAAADAASEAAARVKAMPLRPSDSEIAGCVSALATILSPGDRKILLLSDLGQNHAPQIAGDLSRTQVLVVQPCPSGDASTCTTLATDTASSLKSRGATEVAAIRPEAASPARYSTFWKDGL